MDHDKFLKKMDGLVEAMFTGIPVEYHRTLALKVCHSVLNWVDPADANDLADDIRYSRLSVEHLIEEDMKRDRYHN